MNGYRRRSAIVAVALAATMSAGAVLAADTGLPPGFVKSSLSSLSSGRTTVSKTLARQSLGARILTSTGYDTAKVPGMLERGGIAAVGQALKQSDGVGVAAGARGVAAGASYVGTLRDALAADRQTAAGFSVNSGGSSGIDLASLAQGLTGGGSVGRQTLASSGYGSGSATYGGRSRLSEDNEQLASALESGSSAINLTQVADALTGRDSAGRETLANSGFGTSDPSYSRRVRLTDEIAGSVSVRQVLMAGGGSYRSLGRESGVFSAVSANPRSMETHTVKLPRVAPTLSGSDGSDRAGFATSRIDSSNMVRAGLVRANLDEATLSSEFSGATSINIASLARALTGS
jgi:hypothetical protein